MAVTRASWLLSLALAACGEREVLLARVGGSDAGAPDARTPTLACPQLPSSPTPGATVAYPGYLQPFDDPAFGARVTRITGDAGTPIPRAGGMWSRRTRSIFTTKQVWNADETLLVLHFGGPLLFDGATYEAIAPLKMEAVGSWDPSNPRRMVYVAERDVRAIDVPSGVVTVLATFPGYRDLRQDSDKDQVSLDGRLMAVTATRESDGREVAFVVDLTTGEKRADVVFDEHGFGTPTSRDASVSLNGRFLRVVGAWSGEGRSTPSAFAVFDLDGRKLRELVSGDFCPHVGDLGIDADGRDGEVGRCEAPGPAQGRVVMWRFDDGALILGGPSSTFTSGRAYGRPGWVFPSSATRPLLYATRLGDGTTEYFADARLESPVNYWAQPQSVPSPSGTRVLFASNWGQGAPDDDDAASFVVDFRDACR